LKREVLLASFDNFITVQKKTRMCDNTRRDGHPLGKLNLRSNFSPFVNKITPKCT